MEQYKYIIFSKTCWADQPRLRHHLAHLLGERGAKILFFEKNPTTREINRSFFLFKSLP
jgi:hypothetical protein